MKKKIVRVKYCHQQLGSSMDMERGCTSGPLTGFVRPQSINTCSLCYTYNIHTAQSPSAPHQGLQPIQRSQLPNPLQMGPDKQDKRERKARDFAVAPGKQLLFHPLYTLAFLLQRLDVTVKDSGPFLWRSLVNLYDHFPRTRFPFMFYTIQYKFSHCSARSGFLNLIFFF